MTEDLPYFKNIMIESNGGEIRREDITEYTKQTRLVKMIIAMPWSDTPMEDLANLTINLNIVDRNILRDISGSIFDFKFKELLPEIAGKVVAQGNKMMHYEFSLPTAINIYPYENATIQFKIEKKMKFLFCIIGLCRRPY